jgi:hypothetical protein
MKTKPDKKTKKEQPEPEKPKKFLEYEHPLHTS